MRILWLSNAPWAASGYAEQTAMFVPRLQALGHEMAIMCNHGLEGASQPWQGITCYPSDQANGNRTLGTFADHHKADLVVALCDAWILKPQAWAPHPPVAMWAPVDHHPLPPMVRDVLACDTARPVAMSRHGERMMQDAGLDPLYVPHGVDTSVFRPIPDARARGREKLGIPEDVFLVGMVGANKGHPSVIRKNFGGAFDAFARFAKDHDDAWLYVHAETKPTPQGSGVFLDKLAELVGCPTGGRVRFPHDQTFQFGLPHDALAVIYQAFDVLLMPSLGEGFGIPLIEAQACGVPVITSNHSAMTELCAAGWLCDGDRHVDAVQEAFWFMPAIGSIQAALEASYEAREDRAFRDAAVAFAQGYDADFVTCEYWEPALVKLEQPREVPPLAVNGNRAQRRAAQRQKVTA